MRKLIAICLMLCCLLSMSACSNVDCGIPFF